MASTPTSSSLSQSTSMTTPPQLSPPAAQSPPITSNDNDTSDVWASDSPPLTRSHHPGTPAPAPELSDLPSLRRQHITSGYREGLSIGKARVIQSAFDQGYPLGMSLGLRVGTIIGALEGVLAAPNIRQDEERGQVVEGILERARQELNVTSLLASVEEGVLAGAERVDGLESIEETVRRWEEEVLTSLELAGKGPAVKQRVERNEHETEGRVEWD